MEISQEERRMKTEELVRKAVVIDKEDTRMETDDDEEFTGHTSMAMNR